MVEGSCGTDRAGRADEILAALSRFQSGAAVPDPGLCRQQLPVGIRRAWDEGRISEAEVWGRVARLYGLEGEPATVNALAGEVERLREERDRLAVHLGQVEDEARTLAEEVLAMKREVPPGDVERRRPA